MHRVEPQPVETIFAQPIQRIFDGEGAHLRHPVIDRAAPGGLRLREKARRISAEIISFGAEVVIDHVEKYHQPAQMCFVDQGFEIVGAAIDAVGRVPQHAVIAPIALPCEIRQRHQFKCGDAGRHQMVELADHGAVGAFGCEGADMSFDRDGFLPRASAPIRGAPSVAGVIDHLAGARNIVGLKRGRRIGHIDLVVDPEFVTCAGLHTCQVGAKPAVFAAPQGLRFFQQQIDAFGRRRPQTK